MKKLILILIAIFITSCSPKISTSISQTYKELDKYSKVIVYEKGQKLPEKSKIIGKTKIGDSGFTTNCGYDIMINLAINEAKKNGANGLAITEHILPNLYGSSCHRIKADLLKIENIEEESLAKTKTDSIQKTEKSNNKITLNSLNNSKSKFLFSAGYGFGIRTADLQPGLTDFQKNYLKQLLSGKSYQLSIGYRPKNSKGFYALQYSNYSSSNKQDNAAFTEFNGYRDEGTISDKITIYIVSIGAGYIDKGFLKNDSFMFGMYLGYINYTDVSKLKNTYTITGSNLGLSADIGYYFGLSETIKIGPLISFNGGVLKEFDVKGNNGYSTKIKLPEKTVESLYRFDFMLGTSIQF